jgi:hypothetical protein
MFNEASIDRAIESRRSTGPRGPRSSIHELRAAHAAAAEKAIVAYERAIPAGLDPGATSPHGRAAELLLGLMHWCRASGASFNDALCQARVALEQEGGVS